MHDVSQLIFNLITLIIFGEECKICCSSLPWLQNNIFLSALLIFISRGWDISTLNYNLSILSYFNVRSEKELVGVRVSFLW
jgi:hypothetical protein